MIALADATFTTPSIVYSSLWPILIVFGAACIGVLVEAFLPRERRYVAQVAVSLGALVRPCSGSGWSPPTSRRSVAVRPGACSARRAPSRSTAPRCSSGAWC